MHIMHLITRLLRGGSEENTIETCRYQVQQGHRVTLVHGQEFDPYWYENPIEGVDLICIPQMVHRLRPIQDITAYLGLRRLYLDQNPDVIHTHQSKAGVLGRLASSAVPDCVVIHGIHILPFDEERTFKRMIYLAAERIAARQTDVFLSVSNAITQTFLNSGIAPKNVVHCVRSGMDLNRFKGSEWPADWRDLLRVAPTEEPPRVVLMMAAFEPRKRHAEFVKAFAKEAGKIPNLTLVFAGQGPDEAKVRALVHQLGLTKRIVFCGHRSDPEALLAMADVLVHTSQREGLPRVVVQAFAAGVPVIANDISGLSEIVVAGENGLIIPANDVSETARQMVRILRDRPTLEHLRSGAAATNLDEWDLKHFGERTTAYYFHERHSMDALEVPAE